MVKVNPAEGVSAPRGWKAKQQQAQLRMSGRTSKAERERIRAIRKAHYEGQEFEQPLEEPTALAKPNPRNMTREEILDELSASGVHVGGRIKTETLIEKLEELRDGRESEKAASPK